MPAISRRDIAAAVCKLLAEGSNPHETARSLAAYLIAERRIQELDSLIRDVQQLRADRGKLEVTAATARPLTIDISARVERLFGHRSARKSDVIINKIQDPKLIGGMRLSTVDRELDLTIRKRLDRLARPVAT